MDTPAPLTEAQAAVLDVFVTRAATGTPAPSYRELAKHFGWKSPAAAQKHVAALVRKGRLLVEPGKTRGIHLPHMIGGTVGTIPLVAHFDKLGRPTKVIREIPFTDVFHPRGKPFAFRVTDDRMTARGIHKGDLVVAAAVEFTRQSDLLVVAKNGQARVEMAKTAKQSGDPVIGSVRLVTRFYGFGPWW